MLQEKLVSATPEAAISHSTALDVTTLELSYDPATGNFTLGDQTGTISSGFQIQLSEPGTIHINAGENIQFSTAGGTPAQALPFNTMGGTVLAGFESSFVELEVQEVPPGDQVMGFVFFVELTGETPTLGLETPPVFIVPSAFDSLSLVLSYDPGTGQFRINPNGLDIPAERGQIILRLGTSDSNNQGPLTTVSLNDNGGTLQFVDPFVIFKPEGAAELQFHSATTVVISKEFGDGSGVGVNFVVQFTPDEGAPCTIISPDPIILDKQIGMGGDNSPVS
ncbi:MAG TPA: hypothetical protein VF173_18060 [Thermoanaerobaculia bacterium]|nr:hypothetical protein [Thermoanaerobaculia bacterium]